MKDSRGRLGDVSDRKCQRKLLHVDGRDIAYPLYPILMWVLVMDVHPHPNAMEACANSIYTSTHPTCQSAQQ